MNLKSLHDFGKDVVILVVVVSILFVGEDDSKVVVVKIQSFRINFK